VTDIHAELRAAEAEAEAEKDKRTLAIAIAVENGAKSQEWVDEASDDEIAAALAAGELGHLL
jgi:hypothetical protein